MKNLFLLLAILVLASCTPTYIVTFSGSAGGSVSNFGGEYDEGASVSVSAQPEAGYEFLSWSDGSSQNPRTISVSENLSLTALFGKQQFSVIVNTEGEGTVSSSGATEKGTFEYGSNASIEATPSDGWYFDSWTGNASGNNNPLVISIDEPKTITAVFKRKKFDLTVTVKGEGRVTEQIIVQPGQYDYETQVKLTGVPEEGWVFDEWSGDIESTENPVTVTVDEAKEVTATFNRKKYDLTVTVQGEGTVKEEVIVQPSQYDFETVVRLTAVPVDGWEFSGWSGDVESADNPVTVTVTEAKDITAIFLRKKYDLTVTVVGEGTVKEEVIVQPGQYEHGTKVRLTATPEPGWKFTGWSGGINSEENSIDLTVIKEIEILANFEKVTFVSKVERYSSINESTGYFSKGMFFNNYLSLDKGRAIWSQFNRNYMPDNRDLITYDFNGDGLLDLFMFVMASSIYNPLNPTHNNGKYVFISDYLNQTPPYQIIQHNSLIEFAAGGINLQDLNNDGTKEIIIFTTNNHQKYSRFFFNKPNYLVNPPELLGVVILEVDDKFQIISERTIGTPKGIHGSSTGDVDNDGDIDILMFPLGNQDHQDLVKKRFPTILYNDGNGNFQEDFIFKNQSLEETYWSLGSTSSHFFDIDGDGFLDLLFGQWMGFTNLFTPPNDNLKFLELLDAYILWGDGTGKFSFDDKTPLDLINEKNYNLSLLGMGFTDFDNDGDIDIVLSSTRVEPDDGEEKGAYYDIYVLNLLENQGNRVFKDVTASKINGYSDDNSYIGNIYDVIATDKNGDGLIDLVPKEVTIYCCYGPGNDFVSNLWWENVGGSFVRRIED